MQETQNAEAQTNTTQVEEKACETEWDQENKTSENESTRHTHIEITQAMHQVCSAE